MSPTSSCHAIEHERDRSSGAQQPAANHLIQAASLMTVGSDHRGGLGAPQRGAQIALGVWPILVAALRRSPANLAWPLLPQLLQVNEEDADAVRTASSYARTVVCIGNLASRVQKNHA